jgi:hypothetical protein
MNKYAMITPSRKGSHHRLLRRMSVKVLEGVMNVSTSRATSDNPGWAVTPGSSVGKEVGFTVSLIVRISCEGLE